MKLAEDGKIWMALCVVSVSSRKTSGNIEVTRSRYNERFKYDISSERWIRHDSITLTKLEVEVLKLSMKGYTMKEIAERMCKSFDTVRAYRKSLFCKLEVEHITEAITCATNKKLI
ncbi:MAG: helix-turn-helix transcriptional regulator [Bacteroidales bacterium]